MSSGIDFGNPKPLYEQIMDDLKNKIKRDELKPGEKLAAHQELAKQYKVSLITVKTALSNLTNEGVLFARPGKGTFVADKPIRRVDLSEQRMIGIVLRDLKHPFFSMMVHSIEECAYELGYSVLVSGSSGKMEKEENQIDRFRTMGVSGLIIASLSFQYRATDYIQRLHRENFPYVMVSYMHDPDYWYVGTDHELGGFIATEHLIKLGYKSIGYVHVGKGNLLSEVRKNGYYRALMERGVPYNEALVYFLGSEDFDAGTDRFQLGHQFGTTFGQLGKKPDALFFYNDMVALGFLQAAADTTIRVPDDVAIVGFDDASIARFASVPLTTVHQPVDKIGRLAVETIHKRITRTDVGNRSILKPTLVVRESCGAKKRAEANRLASDPALGARNSRRA